MLHDHAGGWLVWGKLDGWFEYHTLNQHFPEEIVQFTFVHDFIRPFCALYKTHVILHDHNGGCLVCQKTRRVIWISRPQIHRVQFSVYFCTGFVKFFWLLFLRNRCVYHLRSCAMIIRVGGWFVENRKYDFIITLSINKFLPYVFPYNPMGLILFIHCIP